MSNWMDSGTISQNRKTRGAQVCGGSRGVLHLTCGVEVSMRHQSGGGCIHLKIKSYRSLVHRWKIYLMGKWGHLGSECWKNNEDGLGQWFWNFSTLQNQLGSMWKHRFMGPFPSVSDSVVLGQLCVEASSIKLANSDRSFLPHTVLEEVRLVAWSLAILGLFSLVQCFYHKHLFHRHLCCKHFCHITHWP